MIEGSGRKLRRLAWIQLALTVVFAVLTVLAVAVPMWIEEVSGLSPDSGNGEVELLLAIPFGVASLIFAALTWRSRQRLAANLTA
jgi:protein-S-isoprenylcysteine O-methyltransferase Ste14